MKQLHKGIWHAVLILLISGCGGGGGAGGGSSLISVPSLTGLSQTAAAQALNADGLAMQIPFGEQLSAKVPVGVVMSQSPTAGATVAKGTQIALLLSNGPPHTVPDIVGDAQAAAAAACAAAGTSFAVSATQLSSSVPAGDIISQSPAPGTRVALNGAVFGIASLGPPIAVPNAFSATIAVGGVISQSPAPGANVADATAVNLVVSAFPPVAVPNVVGDTRAAATSAIVAAGLNVGGVRPVLSATASAGSIVSQSPGAGPPFKPVLR